MNRHQIKKLILEILSSQDSLAEQLAALTGTVEIGCAIDHTGLVTIKNGSGGLTIEGDETIRVDQIEEFSEDNGINCPSTFMAGSLTCDASGEILLAGNEIKMFGLPASDPAVAGRLWRNGAVVTRSAG